MNKMVKSNTHLLATIAALKKKSLEEQKGIWKAVALSLQAPRRIKRVVNLSKLSRYTKENDVVIVPGKVLGGGDLSHKLTIAAFTFSQEAVEKITKHNGTVLTMNELMEKYPKGTGVKIIG